MQILEPIFLPKPIGLYNTGSICYFNSLLQVLASCTSLRYYPTSNSDLDILFKKYVTNLEDSFASSKLLNALVNKVSFGRGQESASEALTLLLNVIDNNELNKYFIHRFRYVIKCLICNHITQQLSDHSMLFEIFHTTNLTEKQMIEYEIPLSDYKCEKCNNIGATKICRLTMLPEIIICLFNVYYTKKIHTFPNFLLFPSYNGNKLKYMAVGQIEHSGSLNGGHYWARALRNDSVYRFDDISYSKSLIEPTPNTYMVFYHLVSD